MSISKANHRRKMKWGLAEPCWWGGGGAG